MESKELLNEETYQKNNAKVKKTGKILLIVGAIVIVIALIFIILGITIFGNTATNSISSFETTGEISSNVGGMFGSFGFIAIGGFMNFIGWSLVIAGGIMMIISHRREIKAYTTQQVMPVAREGINKMAPTVGNVAKEIAKGIKEGMNEADSKIENSDK